MRGKYPIHRGAGALFDCYKAFKQAADNWYKPPYAYGVFGTETVQAFEKAMAQAESAGFATAFPSGMAAIAATLSSVTAQGDMILLQQDVYTVSEMFADRHLARFGVSTKKINPADPGINFKALKEQGAKVLYLENPSYHDYEIVDLTAVIRRAKEAGLITVVDNSLPTFLNAKPLEEGADIVVYSASKYIAGHGDCLLGVAMTNEPELYKKIRDTQILSGYVTSPEDSALGLRGLETLRARMTYQAKEAQQLMDLLAQAPWIGSIKAPEYCYEQGQMPQKNKTYPVGTGLFSVTFKEKLTDQQLNSLTEAFNKVKIGYGWGSTTTLALPQNDDPKETRMRLSVGMDTAKEIYAELEQGYKSLKPDQPGLSL